MYGPPCTVCRRFGYVERHHRTRARQGWEFPGDIEFLCPHHHAVEHPHRAMDIYHRQGRFGFRW